MLNVVLLYEDSNNIKVSITSKNEDDLNKVKALDSIGWAIWVEKLDI